MNKKSLALIIAVIPLLAAGCTANVVGKYDDYNETFTGNIELDMAGGGYIEVISEPSKITCKGYGQLTYVPLSSHFTGMCKGQRGIAELTCSDGRNISGEWVCKKFVEIEGTAITDANENISFYIEKSNKKAEAKKELYIKETKDNPQLGYKLKGNRKLYNQNYNIDELL